MGVKDRPIWFESFVTPFQSLKNYFYGDLKHFSNIQVKVLSDGKNNIAYSNVISNEIISRPNKLSNILNSKLFICTSIIASVIVYKKGFTFIKNRINRKKFI